MRRRANVDANQAMIVQGLRAVGASVESLAVMGRGVPDLLVGYRARNFLLEVKNPLKSPSGRALRPEQVCWHGEWRGQVAVVHDLREALVAIGAITLEEA
jgi:hypothetical protein